MVSVCNAPGNQTGVLIGRLEGSGYTLIAWMDYRVSNQPRSFYQVLDQTGVPQLEPNGRPVIGDPYWYVGLAYLVPDGEGGLIGVFRDARDGYEDIYGQRFDSLGNRLWGPTGLPLVLWPGSTNTQLKDVEPDAAGGAFVGYGIVAGIGNTDIYLQKIDNSGQMLWGPTGVPIRVGPTNSGEDRIVRDGAGGALDVWKEYSGSTAHLYGQHFDADGNSLWGAGGIPVLDQYGQQIEMGILEDGATDGRGGGIWCWVTPGSSNYLKLIRLSAQGQTLWIWTSPYYGSHSFHDMKRHPAYNTVWLSVSDNRPGAPGDYLYQFDIRGTALFGSGGLPYGGLSLRETSNGMITFSAYEVGQSTRLPAIRVTSTGRLLWVTNAALGGLAQGGGPVFAYAVGASDGADGGVVAFSDYRNLTVTGPDISAQRVQRNGRLGNPTFAPAVADSRPQSLQMLPGGQVQFILPQAGQIKLELFDLLGRKVATLREGFEPAGIQTIPLDNSNLPSGIYLMRLRTSAGAQVIKVLITH
jgi:hypothetical protein